MTVGDAMIQTNVDIQTNVSRYKHTHLSEIHEELNKGGNPSLGMELEHVTRARRDSCECAKPQPYPG